MFRLTEHAEPNRLVLKLEGRCSSDVIAALIASWLAARLKAGTRPIYIDLTGALVVDDAVREQLARMHLAGACFESRGCLMREVVRQITDPPTTGK
jgi:hypothetical protein